jgi:hypothetical protein
MNALLRLLLIASALAALRIHAAEPHPSLPAIGSLDGLGVNIHFTDPQPGELEMIAAAGFKWVRMDLTWAGIERKKGEYDFSACDRLVAALDKQKMRAVFILDYGNPLYAEPGDKHPFTSRAGTAEFSEAYAKWAVAAVSRYKGKGFIWEIWNEPNHAGFWKPKPNEADYIELVKATAAALREAGLIRRDTLPRVPDQPAPTITPEAATHATESGTRGSASLRGEAIIGPATSTIDLPFLEECFKAGLLEYWAAVSVHPYRQKAPETVEDEYRSVRLLIRKYAPKDKAIPILSGEWGYSTAWPQLGKDEAAREEVQAKYLARMFLTNIANDIPLSIWYDWRDDGDDPKEAEHRFGLVRRPYHEGRAPVFDPKPAYQAAKTLTGQLAGMRFNKRIAGTDSHEFLFSRENETRIVTWRTGSERHGSASLLDFAKPLSAVDTFGNARKLAPDFSNGRSILYDAPIYMGPGEESGLIALQLAAAWERLPLEFLLHAPEQLVVPMRFQNPFSNPVELDTDTSLPWQEPQKMNCVTGPSKWEPRLEAGPNSKISEYARINFMSRRSPEVLVQWLHASLNATHGVSIAQESLVLLTNPLDVALLPMMPGGLLLQVTNPSRESFDGELEIRFSGVGHTERGGKSQPLNIVAGEQEVLVPVTIDPGQDFADANELAKNWPEWHRRISITAKDGSTHFFKQIWRSAPLEPWALEALSVQADGAPDVSGIASIDTAQPTVGHSPSRTPSIRLKYSFAAGWKFVRACFKSVGHQKLQRLDAPGSPAHGLLLWLHGDGKGCQARIRFSDSTGQVFQADGPKIDWKGWRHISFPMQSTEGAPLAHWGGANDGEIHFPIKWDTIFLLDNVSREPVEGEIHLSAPTLIY